MKPLMNGLKLIFISITVLILSYLILLNLFFTEDVKVETYVCFVNDNGSHYHSPYCSYTKNESKQTTIYEAQKEGYRFGNCCNLFRNETFETTLYLREQNYLYPAGISVVITITSCIIVAENLKRKTSNDQ